MTDRNKFGDANEVTPTPIDCVVCEAMCPDAVDGMLTDAERKLFDRHVAHCAACAQELEEAQRGAAWLGMLKGHTPEPPPALLAKILAETTEAAPARHASPVASNLPPNAIPARDSAPAWALTSVLRRLADAFHIESARASIQPRLAMTAAMAFVSIALTLNLGGVRLKNLRASDFTPSGLRRDAAQATASASRNFQNMRVVYQVESRVSELRGEGPLAQHEEVNFTPPESTNPQPPPEQKAAPAPRLKPL